MDDSARAAGGTLGEYALQGGRERPMAEVFRDIIANVHEMVRSEVRLARVEIREETAKTARAGAMLGAGAVMAMIAGVFLLVCIAQLLDLFMPDWAAALVVALAMGIPAAILISKGRDRLHVPVPEKTIDNVKENVEWMKNQTKS
ncbi:MAG TPA: phage holin family protein [Bryobacteraceae bacterium]|nr:phage holin family protein [Bryobacteraceae bacterium]